MQIINETSSTLSQPCVATIGFFDGVHTGHRFLIEQVRKISAAKGLSSALVTFPLHPRKVMKPDSHQELLTTPQEKIELLESTGVDYCLIIDFTPQISQLTAREFMTSVLKEKFHVNSLVIGYDHRFGHNRKEAFEDYVEYGKSIGIEVIRAAAYDKEMENEAGERIRTSSSFIRQLLHQGKMDFAARCLGYNYFLEGLVVDGHKVGRKIGFPTANLKISNADKLVPPDGVYAVWVTVDNRIYKGVLNIGIRPTLNNGNNRTIEVNILHFDSDIYGKPIRVSFVKRIRDELKFDQIDQLIDQMKNDVQEADLLLK